MLIRSFQLIREVDNTGTSGTGIVAKGWSFFGRLTILTWIRAATLADGSERFVRTWTIFTKLENVVLLHGHGGGSHLLFSNGQTWSDLQILGLEIQVEDNVVDLAAYRARKALKANAS